MKTELIDHPLFLQIKAEHDHIRSLIHQYNTSPEPLTILKKLELFAELEHHTKEENLLFAHLLNFEAVNSGGPLCMLYLDDYMLNHPIEIYKKITGREPEIDDRLKEFFVKASAMRIPINDHLGGKMILHYLIENYENLEKEKRTQFFKAYQSIQDIHMQKEENCFFFLCANFLTQSSADQIYQKWNNNGDPS
jgi:hemerythrin-like domain-containing protein